MEYNPDVLNHDQLYRLLVGSVVPRPIAWVSTLNGEGQRNLAPFSFFNVACPQPPTLVFAPLVCSTDGAEKDTLRNIRATGEFVINVVTEANVEAANFSSGEYPAHVDEFALVNVTAVPSVMVAPPRVFESPVNFECRLKQIVELGDEPGGASLVIGSIVYIHVADEVLAADYKIDADKLQAVGRLAGFDYSRTRDRFVIVRPPSQIKPTAKS